MHPTSRRAVLFVAVALVLLLLPLPPMDRVGRALQDLAHVPVAGLLALVVFGALRRRLSAPAAAALSLLAVSLLLLAVEYVQPAFGRGWSLADIRTGVLAAAGCLLVALAWPQSFLPRLVGVALGVAAVGLACAPAGSELLDVARQHREMPMLASFETELELRRWWFRDARARRVGNHVTHGRFALRVALLPGRYPSATLAWPVADWRGWGALTLDVWLEGPEGLEAVLKIVDAEHDDTYEDRFHAYLHLEPGANRIDVPLAEVARAPRTRRLDLGRVAGVQLFVDGLDRVRVVYLDRLRLVP